MADLKTQLMKVFTSGNTYNVLTLLKALIDEMAGITFATPENIQELSDKIDAQDLDIEALDGKVTDLEKVKFRGVINVGNTGEEGALTGVVPAADGLYIVSFSTIPHIAYRGFATVSTSYDNKKDINILLVNGKQFHLSAPVAVGENFITTAPDYLDKHRIYEHKIQLAGVSGSSGGVNFTSGVIYVTIYTDSDTELNTKDLLLAFGKNYNFSFHGTINYASGGTTGVGIIADFYIDILGNDLMARISYEGKYISAGVTLTVSDSNITDTVKRII